MTKILSNSLKTFGTLAIALSSTIALAQPTRTPTVHLRAATYHDHGSQYHDRSPVAHH